MSRFSSALNKVLAATWELKSLIGYGHATFKQRGSNQSTRVYIMPSGAPTGTRAALKIFATDYEADDINYADVGLYYETSKDAFLLNLKANGSVGSKNLIVTAQDGTDDIMAFARNRMTAFKRVRYLPQTEPTSPAEGDMYYDSGLKKIRFYNGSAWETVTSS